MYSTIYSNQWQVGDTLDPLQFQKEFANVYSALNALASGQNSGAILAALLNADGVGSGLDADLFNGLTLKAVIAQAVAAVVIPAPTLTALGITVLRVNSVGQITQVSGRRTATAASHSGTGPLVLSHGINALNYGVQVTPADNNTFLPTASVADASTVQIQFSNGGTYANTNYACHVTITEFA